MKPHRNVRRWAVASPSANELNQIVNVYWVLDGVIQAERGRIVGLADSPPDLAPGWWYLIEIIEGLQPGSRDWFTPQQVTLYAA